MQIGSDDVGQALAVLLARAKNESAAAEIVDLVLDEFVRPHHRSISWGDRLLTLDKSAAFRNDARFREALGTVTSSTGQNQYSSPHGISWRLNTLQWAARSALQVQGDFIECGVFRGDMAWVVQHVTRPADCGKTFYLFDTFEGFDPRYSSPSDFPDTPELYYRNHQEFSAAGLYQEVRSRFSGMPWMRIIKGVVPDILNSHAPETVAFLHLDMNSPAAEIGALDILFDRISPGGVVIFDDYGWILHSKQREAADAFVEKKSHLILELPTGQGMLVKHG